MAAADDDRFRPLLGAPKARGRGRPQAFISRVLKAASASGAKPRVGDGRPASSFGRGRVAAGAAGRRLGADARRVVVKSRFVVLRRAGKAGVLAHLRYIERDGVTRDGQKAQAYGAETDVADLKAFEARGRGDRHQFRLIVSPEDAAELDDLRGFTRRLMQQMATDLETPLDWVAVDHWDTDNPHTHIVLRGRVGGARDERDLVIAPDYAAHGIRHRASEIVTQWLGPRTELEIQRAQQREVQQERLTGLDRQLLRQAVDGVVVLRSAPVPDRVSARDTLLRGRLQRLGELGLARKIDAHRWQLSPRLADTLSTMGQRGDILRTLHRAMAGEARSLVPDPPPDARILGRVHAKGLHDELLEQPYLVIDGIDGRAHYVRLPAGRDLSGIPVGSIVACGPPPLGRAADGLVRAAAQGGLYEVAAHRAALQTSRHPHVEQVLAACARRLEALRRGGVVERVTDGVWRIPDDLAERARDHDGRKGAAGLHVDVRCHLPVEQQVHACGATWLDRQLVGAESSEHPAAAGFGAQVRRALEDRLRVLASQGLAQQQGAYVVPNRNLLQALIAREVEQHGRALEAETGKVWRAVQDGVRAQGTYRTSVQLVSGRFALLDDGHGFCLVPWRPVIETRLGQALSVTVRGSTVNWEVGRSRGIGR
ncbi:DUF3363 domain-containing protein [Pseudacidovorax sp. RU35E]|uniref:DUF3363 domain-containing protein n=1 Tax=Pseudacidovorax sp. RU35E TaxID=1907403 RepID=UPI0009555AE1|nr:DUF3363 domain-containing protein [Pseudacidovorax sp. RU35E]SIR71406.1 Type IV secretory pathway, VirD2 components (relaxase) [Pseudacidovorax sp. RU35E]